MKLLQKHDVGKDEQQRGPNRKRISNSERVSKQADESRIAEECQQHERQLVTQKSVYTGGTQRCVWQQVEEKRVRTAQNVGFRIEHGRRSEGGYAAKPT